jgi:signal transduction histidine kinase/ActR/RegA family two-component response regulator
VLFVIFFILQKNRAERRYRTNLEDKVEEITELNSQLKENQEMLEETSAEQEAQLEEITALNDELESKQEKLEETSAELEAQMEEITALNDEMESQQGKLEEACKQAEAANNAKTSFLFNMSHDIRTPMNAIIGFADLLEKHQEEPEKRADYLKKIQDSSTVLLSIINNVLEMARIEKGTLVIDEVAWSAEQFNDTLYSVFQDMMIEKDIEFTRQINVEHQYVLCDPIKLREVFINILSNAYKYTETGGKVHMQLEEIPSNREGYAMYQTTISDTGIGMAEDFLPHIFEEFSRENNTTDNKIEGTGLGMPIVKRLIDFMEGTIEVYSKKGEGSTFIVTIPHKIAYKSDLTTHYEGKTDTDMFKGKRILLAEDNELNAEIAIEILTEVGFEVDRAEDGQVCVDMLQNAENYFYDVILMDIQMPNMNGYEATKAIRALPDDAKAEIPIIAMTANAFEEDKRDAMRAGMNGHLAKPINVRELYKTLSGILEI